MKATPNSSNAIAWMSHIEDATPELDAKTPVTVHTVNVATGRSTIPHPHRHACFELTLQLAGEGTLFVGRESVRRQAHDLLLLSPGIPHWYEIESPPVVCIVIFFLPQALFNFSPALDVARLLSRFIVSRSLQDRHIRLPFELAKAFEHRFQRMAEEANRKRLGWQAHVQADLVQILVEFARWDKRPALAKEADSAEGWRRIVEAIGYLQDHLFDVVYGHNLAKVVGLSESGLHRLFRRLLGTTWIKYHQSLRVQRAIVLMTQGGQSVTEAALAVGFESLSHFNATFRRLIGTSPTDYLQRLQGKPENSKRRTKKR